MLIFDFHTIGNKMLSERKRIGLQIGDIPSDYTLRYLINLSDIQLIIAPSFKEAQRVLVALQCLCSELSASAINHELINLIFDA